MPAPAKSAELSCSDCAQVNCRDQATRFPPFCLTEALEPEQLEGTLAAYQDDGTDARIARAAAEVEGVYYGKLTRVEETIAFARRLGARTIGIATCVGLMAEARTFAKVVKLAGLTPVTVACKIGATDKCAIGLPDQLKIRPGTFEALCNPILQARLLNARQTELNVVIGLCVGHDALFIRHAEAPTTVLVVKDRVLCHNPAAAFYTVNSYTARLLNQEHLEGL